MHTPTGEAKAARAALQSIYDRFLRRVCGVRHMPSAVLLGELALSPLQVFWWQQTSEFWNMIAANPVGSLFHTILLGNIHDAFHVGRGAKNFSSSVATCLQSVGHSMPRDSEVVPVMSLLRFCVKAYVVLTVMPCTVLGQPHLQLVATSIAC